MVCTLQYGHAIISNCRKFTDKTMGFGDLIFRQSHIIWDDDNEIWWQQWNDNDKMMMLMKIKIKMKMQILILILMMMMMMMRMRMRMRRRRGQAWPCRIIPTRFVQPDCGTALSISGCGHGRWPRYEVFGVVIPYHPTNRLALEVLKLRPPMPLPRHVVIWIRIDAEQAWASQSQA